MAIKVKATRLGEYPTGHLRKAGDMFTVPNEKALGKWMERVDAPKGGKPDGKPANPNELA